MIPDSASVEATHATPAPATISRPGGSSAQTLEPGNSPVATPFELAPQPSIFTPVVSGTLAPSTLSITSFSDSNMPLTSVCDDLGATIPQHLKDKIWRGEYVEFGTLLKSSRGTGLDNSFDETLFTIGSNESPLWQIRPHKQAPRITSIEQWTSAFLVFASVYLLRHPTHARSLLKYADTIRSAAFRHVGYGWREYDIQFRLRQARVPSRS